MLPLAIKKIIANDALAHQKSINECRVSMPAASDFIQVTNWREVHPELGAHIEQNRKSILKDVQAHIPQVVNVQVMPVKSGDQSVLCSCVTLQMNARHNTIDEIVELGEFAERVNETILDANSYSLRLDAINKDLAPLND